MALINCLECGQRISDKAKNCPKCGWRVVVESSVDFYGNKLELKEKVNNPVKKKNTSQKNKNTSYKNKSVKTSGSIKPSLIKAYQLRQKDNGWGYAISHIIPFIWIYYAFTRKTLTPFGANILVSGICGFLPGEAWVIQFLFIPLATKAAINQAREFGKQKLKENGISDSETFPDLSKNKFCKQCGAAMDVNDIYCRSCGFKN